MRIVMLVKNTFTHDIRVEREALTLIAQGFDVFVVALQSPVIAIKENVKGINIVRVPRPGSRIRSFGDPTSKIHKENNRKYLSKSIRIVLTTLRVVSTWRILSFLHNRLDSAMYSAAIALEPDFIHAHDLETLAVASRIKHKLDIPLVYDSHEMATGRNLASNSMNRRAENLERRLIPEANAVIMASGGYAEKISNLYGVNDAIVIRNVPRFISEFRSELDLRKIYSIAEEYKLMVHQGSILPNRGIEQTITSLKYLPNCVLVVIGYGHHVNVLKELATKEGVSARVIFHGPVPPDDLISLASSADVGICTIVGNCESYLHSMPNKLFEYLMAEIPIIVSDYPGMGKFVLHNRLGFVCNPLDPRSISDAVNSLFENFEIKESIVEACRLAKKDACWETEQEKLHNIYLKMNSA